MKTCTKCDIPKIPEDFSKSSNTRDGLHYYCRVCNSIKCAQYRAANREKVLAGKAKYRAANLEKCNSSNAKWRSANTERHRANASKWAAANLDSRRIYSHNYRARLHASGGKLSKGLAERLFKLQKGKCACGCKQSLGDNCQMDHIMPVALGGANEDWNIQLLRAICNQRKRDKHPVDFMQSKGFLL